MSRSLLILALIVVDAVLAILGAFSVFPHVLRYLLARWRESLIADAWANPRGIPWRDLRAVTPKL